MIASRTAHIYGSIKYAAQLQQEHRSKMEIA
jgi:hypothetical protein